MLVLESLITNLSKQEAVAFAVYLHKKNKVKDAKNSLLFKLLRSDKNYSAKEICIFLYGKDKRNAYHALRNRLYHNVIGFISKSHLEEENSVEMDVIKYLIVARTIALQNNTALALQILEKAEKIAKEHYLFSLLNEIYHSKIQFHKKDSHTDLYKLITDLEDNQRHYIAEERLNVSYAIMKKAIDEKRHKGESINFDVFVKQALAISGSEMDIITTFKSLYQLISIISYSALFKREYDSIVSLVEKIYNKIQLHPHKEKQLYYHIEVLYQMAYIQFRVKDFVLSMKYLEKMHQQMDLKKRKYFSSFYPKKVLLKALNFFYLGDLPEAIYNTENMLLDYSKEDYTVEARLYLSIFYFQDQKFSYALQLINAFPHRDAWYQSKVGIEWVLTKSIIELLLLFELDMIELAYTKLVRFKRKYKEYMNEQRLVIILTYLEWLHSMLNDSGIVNEDSFKKLVCDTMFKEIPNIKDVYVLSFYAWFYAKIHRISYYEATIYLIGKS